MSELFSPTPFGDVNLVLDHFLAGIRNRLGSHFLGMYLVGSLALGDFDPRSSDIDFVVVTGTSIEDDLFEQLQEMHTHFAASSSPWADKIEAIYVPTHALSHSAANGAHFPQIERGTGLFKAPLEMGWVFHCLTLRDHGVVVAGPEPRTMVEPIKAQDLYAAAAAITGFGLEQAATDPTWLPWLRQREGQTFVVLTLCRLLYSLAKGSVASKPQAAEWAKKELGEPWSALIEGTLAKRHEAGTITQGEEDETVAFIKFTFERSTRMPPN